MKGWLLGVALTASFAAPAAAEVISSSEAGFVIRLSTEVAAKPDDAWKELVTPADWWNKAHTWSGDAANLYIDSQATGCFCEKLPAPKDAPAGRRPGSVEHMRIIHVDPGKVLRMSGALGPLQSEALTGTLTITLKPAGAHTRILWEYVVGGYMRFKPAEIAPAVDRVLAGQLDTLAANLGPITPPPAAKGAAPKISDPQFLGDAPGDKAKDEAEKPKPAKPPSSKPRAPQDDETYVEPTR